MGTADLTTILIAVGLRLGLEVEYATEPVAVSEGFDTSIWLVDLAGDDLSEEWCRPLVLRIHPEAGRQALAEREASVQGCVSSLGYPAPKVLMVLGPDDGLTLPVQVMERVSGITMLGVIEKRPWTATGLFARLGRMHARLHALSTARWPFPEETQPGTTVLADRRIRLAVRLVAERPELGGAALAKAVDSVRSHLIPALAVDDPVICHGDFHPMNVLVNGASMSVIDWTDACLGDRHGDVARLLTLLREAVAGAPRPGQRLLLRATRPMVSRIYLKGYERAAEQLGLPPLDRDRLARWEPVHLTHDWARTLLTLSDPGQSERMAPGALPWIQARLASSLVLLN